MLRDQVREGDRVFIYHSSCALIGIAGVARVIHSAYPDPTQFDPESDYFDPASQADNPRWIAVDVVHERTFAQVIPLQALKAHPALIDLAVAKKGSRLSVTPVRADEWKVVLAMAAE